MKLYKTENRTKTMQTEHSCGTKNDDANDSKNTNLFSVIRSKLSSAEKLKKFTQYLKEGADLNSLDTNDKNNTLLHVAAINGEVEIVKLLLHKNADATITNNDNDTVLDVIQKQETSKSLEIAAILYKKFGFQKRLGTSGVRGQLFETKLLSLILFRVLYDEDIKEFILGTNLDDIGALDDIILRYNTKHQQKTKMLFLQAKHRENEIFTVDDLLNPKKDTNLYKYFESYLRVRHKFITDNNNTMFQGMIKNIDCEFVIYTTAKHYNNKDQNTVRNINLKQIQEGKNLIKATKKGKVLQVQYANEFDDFAEFVATASRTRATELSQSFVKFIIKDNSKYKNMMLDNIIKEYHIYLAQNIVETNVGTSNDAASDSSKVTDHLVGRFHSSFLISDNENLQRIKFEIHKELAEIKGLSPNSDQDELNKIMKSFTFKLPTDFGDHQFSFGGNKKKQQSKLTHLCSIFEKIFQSTCVADSSYIYIHLDDDSVGPDGIVQSKDLGKYWLGGLVGNLLVHDDETEMLKFNINGQNLSEDNIKILQKLNENRDITQLTKFRFNINFLNFPKLTLNSKLRSEYDQKLVKHFLDNLRIYTNQAKEDEVEKVLKDEIYTLYNNRKKHPDFLFHIKCDAIFLTVHDNIQRWWKQPNSAPYLTEKCKFYQEVEREIIDSPILSVVHFICCKNIINSLVDFEQNAIDSMKISEFLKSKETIFNIISDEINFSSVKVTKFLNKNENQVDFKMINLDFEIVKTCYDFMTNELANPIPVTSTLVVVIQGITDVDYWRLCNITDIFKGKIIIITNNSVGYNFKVKYPGRHIYRDTTNNYANLSSTVRKIILKERKIIFQGFPVSVDSVLSYSALDLFSPVLLWKIIHKDTIVIGNKINVLNETLDDPDITSADYVNRNLSRIIAMNEKKNYYSELCFKEDNNKDFTLEENKDIVVISDSENTFKETCKMFNSSNIHWFRRIETQGVIVWNKSKGSIETLKKYVHKSLQLKNMKNLKNVGYVCGSQIMTLKDVQDRIVIINAEPGMGKSTLLTYLANNTKRDHPNLWIVRINLLESHFLDQFSIWKKSNLNIDMVNVMIFLYSSINKKYYTNNDICLKISKLITVNNINEVHISVSDDKNRPEIDLSEIKLLNYFYNHDKLIVLLDGFDEICPDYTDQVLQILKILKTSKVGQLWITSRPYDGLEKLELVLETFSFTLDPLNIPQQIKYLLNVWSRKFCRDETFNLSNNVLYKHINNFYQAITHALNNREFTSIPLHLYMISEIFENLLVQHINGSLPQDYNGIPDLTGILNVTTLYEKFTKKSFHMQFEKNNSAINSKDPYVNKLKQDAYKLFIKNHKNVAAYLLLDKSIVLPEHNIESIQDFILDVKSDIEKTSIITYIDNNPTFVHYTFTEYFAVEFLFDEFINLSKTNSGKSYRLLWQYMIDNILLTNDKQGIRRFINSKLQRDRVVVASLMSKEEYMTTVLDILLAQFKNLQTSALFVAIEENFEHIAMFLIECIKAPVNKINLSTLINIFHMRCNKYCVLCLVLRTRNESVTKNLMELFTMKDCDKLNTFEIRDTSDLFTDVEQRCVSLHAILYLDQLTMNIVGQFLTKNDKYWGKATDTAHYVIGRHGFLIMLCHDYIARLSVDQRLQLFNDKEFKNPSVHYGLEQLHYNWITAGAQKEEFIKMCTTLDVSTLKSVMLMLKRILIKVNNKRDADVESFIFETLPKLEFNFVKSSKEKCSTKYSSYTSLLSNLVLLRLLFSDHIKEFTLRSFRKDIGLFDDIVLRYKTCDSPKSKMIFLQLQNLIDTDSIMFMCFQCYLLIREKFRTNNENPLFLGTMKDLDYKFIINTKGKNNFSKTKIFQHSDDNNLFKTNNDFKILQYNYTKENIESFLSRLCNFRAHELGECILSIGLGRIRADSVMKQHLIKMYHILIAKEIIKIDSLSDESREFSIGRFRSSFLTSGDKYLKQIRKVIYKKYEQDFGLKVDVENKMKTLRFVLPLCFGKSSFSFIGNEIKQQEKLDRLLTVFLRLCNNHHQDDSDYTVIEFDDFSMTPYNLKVINNFQIKDLLENDSLAGLVGNLLVLDEETGALKINFNEESLSKDSVKVLEGLKQNFEINQLSKFRFDINIHGFPKLSFKDTEYDRNLATDFLNNLQFYTNQASEDDIEDVLKQELNKYFCVLKKQDNFLFRVKCDAIFFSHLSMSDRDDSLWTYSTE